MSDSITYMARLAALQDIQEFVSKNHTVVAVVVPDRATFDQFDSILQNDLKMFYGGATCYYRDKSSGAIGLYMADETSHVFVRISYMFDLTEQQQERWHQIGMAFFPEYHVINTCEER